MGCGKSVFGSRWQTTPTDCSRRTASSTAATLIFRPKLSGARVNGKSTELRSGRIIKASSGQLASRRAGPAWAFEAEISLELLFPLGSIVFVSFMLSNIIIAKAFGTAGKLLNFLTVLFFG